MNRIIRGRRIHLLTYLMIMAVLLMFGCASEKTAKKEDPFFDKWSNMAETNKGSSPTEKEKEIVLPTQAEIDAKISTSEPSERSLPKNRITIKLRQADVKSVLRSLARITGQNLLVKNEVKGEISVDFQNVPWDEAFLSILKDQALTYVWEGDILRVMTLADLDQEFKRKSQELGTKLVEPLVTVVVKVDYADASKLKENVQEFLTRDKDGKARGSVRVDEHSNALIIQAIRDDLNRMIPIIEKIDKPTQQIYIRANIVETTKETARDLGIQWGGLMHTGNVTITPGGKGTAPGSDVGYNPVYGDTSISKQGWAVNFPVDAAKMAAAGGSGSIGLIVGAGGYVLETQLTALQKDGKLNILSSPSITTLDNQKAFTENGMKVPYVSLNDQGEQEVKFEDAVLRLEITPHVIDKDNLKLKIFVKKDEVDPIKNVRGNPYIIKKQTETNLIVKNGDTIVISGLTKQTTNDGDTGVPWLKDIPGLGHLFKKTSVGDTKEEVLIFITPQILKTELSKADVSVNVQKQ